MGARGPAPQPDAPNSTSAYRARVRQESAVRVAVEAPDMPSWLDHEGKAEWRRQVSALLAQGTLAKIDRPLLALYCHTWSEWMELRRQTADERTVKGSAGSLITNPLVTQRNAAADRLADLGAKFGFSPAARCRLDVLGAEAKGLAPEGSVLAFARKRG